MTLGVRNAHASSCYEPALSLLSLRCTQPAADNIGMRTASLTAFRAMGWMLCLGLLPMSLSAIATLSGNTQWTVSAHDVTILWVVLPFWLAIAWVLVALIVMWARRRRPDTKTLRLPLTVVTGLAILGFCLLVLSETV
jgi:hypothetical protein